MKAHRWTIVGLLPILSFVIGLLEYGPTSQPGATRLLGTMHVLASVAVVFCWFWFDAIVRQHRASVPLRLSMMAMPVFALPYYLFKTRGPLGGFQALATSLLVFVSTMMAYRAGSFIRLGH